MIRLLQILLLMVMLPLTAAEWHPVRLTFSGGESKEGEIALLGSRPLTINCNPDARSYNRKIQLDDMISVTQAPEQQSMERPWMYTEAGKADKTYFGGEYPLVNFRTDILLTTGEVVRGHIIALPLRFKGDGPKKMFLNRQLKGKVGEKMGDLNYIEKIEFLNRRIEAAKPVSGEVKGYGKLLEVTALDNRREVIVAGEVKGDRFEFKNLLPGSYDLFILTSEAVLAGFSDDAPLAGEALPGDALAGLNKVFPLADDFFRDRWILLVGGNRKFTKTLVYKRRADFYHAKQHVNGGFVWHLEVWSWHFVDGEWKVDRRSVGVRRKQQGGEMNRKLWILPGLSGVKPGSVINLNAENRTDGGKFIRNLD